MSKNNKNKNTSIGGQAVIEGVMMRGKTAQATSVRDADGIVRTETKRIVPLNKRNFFFRMPIVRGVVSFVSSLVNGTKVLMRSAEVYGEEEPTKAEKWMADKLKINVMSVVMTFSMVLALGLAIFLFMFLPQLFRRIIETWCGKDYTFGVWAKNFIEGGFKLLIFISYVFLVSLIKDVKRTFMYHGAEHKTISCYENGLTLTVENAKKCSRIHDRCGTTFMVFVLSISIIVFALFESLLGGGVEKIYRIFLKIALLPLVAGLSYELLKLLSKTQSKFLLPLKFPGMLLQRITTREPDEKMLEVAITAFNTVMETDSDPEIQEKSFVVSKRLSLLIEDVKKKLSENGITEDAEAEWIISISLGIKRDQLSDDKLISPKFVEKIDKIVNERITGRPLWYCIGDVDFYGYVLKVDERVLIPRPETELLVENALKYVSEKSSVLDLCTGSGAVAIAINKKTNANLVAVDISDDALSLAKENAKINNATVSFVKSDMFSSIKDRKFDVIVSNPPYIKTDDISVLQREIKDFEPVIALDGGKDGLVFYRIIADNAFDCLNETGVLLVECGFNQAQDIKTLFKKFKSVEVIKDYENNDRIVKAVK